MLLRNMSFRFKLPLCMVFASALTAAIAIMFVSWQYYQGNKNMITQHNRELGNSMLDMLSWSIKNNDIWHAYTLLRGNKSNTLPPSKRTLILFDNQKTVFASNQPERFPTGTAYSDLTMGTNAYLVHSEPTLSEQKEVMLSTENYLLSSLPIISDNISVGSLVIVDPYEPIITLFNKTFLSALMVVFFTIAALIPIAWIWGKHITNPLVKLESCISKVGKVPLDDIQCAISDDNDEIGQLGKQFQSMVDDLKKKSEIENQMIQSNRLAAAGTLAAGVAHEINNPLAGMLMAVDTYKQYCNSADCQHRNQAQESIDLVERGLAQIKETVSALLVNVNTKDKPVTRIDIDDVLKLIFPRSRNKSIVLEYQNDIDHSVALPSTPIRQVLINLLLNAVDATEQGGHIIGHIHSDTEQLQITIKNDGSQITDEQLEHLFEPFYSSKKASTGLGLWVTYQIVRNLKGSISVNRAEGWSIFEITIPIS